MEKSPRNNYEAQALGHFDEVLRELGMEADGRGQNDNNRFDAGFGLTGTRRFQFGDIRKVLLDRVIVVEVESGGGLHHLLQYWPLAELPSTTKPILLLHVYGGGTKNNYISARKLWDFTWERIKPLLWQNPEPRFFARKFEYAKDDDTGLKEAVAVYRQCLTEPLAKVCQEVFGYDDFQTGAIG